MQRKCRVVLQANWPFSFMTISLSKLIDGDSRLAENFGILALSKAPLYLRSEKNYSHGKPMDALCRKGRRKHCGE